MILQGLLVRTRLLTHFHFFPVLKNYKSGDDERSHRRTFQNLGGCQGRRTGVAVTTVSNSLILGGWVTKVLKNGDKN